MRGISVRCHELRLAVLFLVVELGLAVGLLSAQAQKPAAPAAIRNPEKAEQEEREEADRISPDTPVITLDGFCDPASAAAKDKTACRTVITRSDFEKLADAQQGADSETYRGRSQFAAFYVKFLMFAREAQKRGMEKEVLFQRKLEMARIQLLGQMLLQDFQDKSLELAPGDLEKFFHENPAPFEQATLLRVYIPTTKLKDLPNGVQQPIAGSAPEMKLTAEAIYSRARSGADFEALQKEAAEAANLKDVPDSRIEKISRDHLLLAHRGAFDLKPGEVSKPLDDSEGYYIYKMVSKEMPSFESVKSDVGTALQKHRMDTWVNSITNPVHVTMDEEFFGTNPMQKKDH
jgi:hypothetical protein